MISIALVFDKTETGLAGNPYGKSVYKKQVKDRYTDFSKKLEIVFPDNIEQVASSFVQGFFSELVDEIGYEGIEQNVSIKAKDETLADTILKRLY